MADRYRTKSLQEPSAKVGHVWKAGFRGAVPWFKPSRTVMAMLATLLPVVLFSAAMIFLLEREQDLQIRQILRYAAAAGMNAVDRELESHISALQTMAASMAVDEYDLLELDEQLRASSRLHPDWVTVTVVDAALGMRIYDQRFGILAVPQPSAEPVTLWQTVREGVPVVSGLLTSTQLAAEPVLMIRAPVMRQGQVAFLLTAVVRASFVENLFRSQALPEEWRVGVIDHQGLLIGGNPATGAEHAAPVREIRDRIPADIARGPGPVLTIPVDKGADMYVSTHLSARGDWITVVAVPRDLVEWNGRISSWLAGAMGVAALLLTLLTGKTLIDKSRRQQVAEREHAVLRQVEARLAEKETLLREVHHRVKNNLQAIWGLIQIERGNMTDTRARERLEMISQRLSVLGNIHEQLYRSDDFGRIDLSQNLSRLADSVKGLYAGTGNDIAVDIDAGEFLCILDTAMPIGLIVNELLSNSFKYAFPNGRPGSVRVVLRECGDRVLLEVSDDGVGRDPNAGPGLGTTIIDALSSQIEAQVEISPSHPGCVTRIWIPPERFVPR